MLAILLQSTYWQSIVHRHVQLQNKQNVTQLLCSVKLIKKKVNPIRLHL